MAAAYAAVVSLINTIHHLQINHPRLLISSFDNKQIQYLQENAVFLQQFLEESRQQDLEEGLESLIAPAARTAEDAIGSHAMREILDKSTGNSSSFLLDLQIVIQGMGSVREKVTEVIKGKEMAVHKMHQQQPTHPTPATSSTLSTTEKSSMVGFDEYLNQLMDMLLAQQSSRQVISLTGMGGIGKTTLIKNAYNHLTITDHFDFRAWAAVSQQCNVAKILVEILACLKKQKKSEIDQISEDQLGLQLHKFLFGRRYLVVIDDVWSVEVWNKMKYFFPDNGNSSRIVITTRESSLAIEFGSSILAMSLLDEDKSWQLFCEKTFGQKDLCPPELKTIGRQISQKCKGLPLSIVVIGGLLRNSNKSEDYWMEVAGDINSIVNSGEHDVLSLSYTHLPAYLEPCFLYMGIFPEDHKIVVSKLIRLWIAEGFLKPNNTLSLEEVAYVYLKDLVDRNLILVEELGYTGKIKICKIHDLLRDLCLSVSKNEKMLCFTRVLDSLGDMDKERRTVFSKPIWEGEYDPIVAHALELGLLGPALVCHGDETRDVLKVWKRSLDEGGEDPLKPIFEQVRYIAFDGGKKLKLLSSSISLCWNLQTLVIQDNNVTLEAPSEIWKMRQLRHVKTYSIHLPLPLPHPSDQQDDDIVVLTNLQTLTNVINLRLNEDVCKRIPNIKRLNLDYYDRSNTISNYCLHNLVLLQKLESLHYSFSELPDLHNLSLNLAFPNSLKKLHLAYSKLPWEYLTTIGSLPHLEVLKLQLDAAVGEEWSPVEGQFLRLKYLTIYLCSDLIYLNAHDSHFPVLQSLTLFRLNKLNEIPSSIGDIPTLQSINVAWCSESTAISAANILEEQESYGNESINVQVMLQTESELARLMEKLEPHGTNLQYFVQTMHLT